MDHGPRMISGSQNNAGKPTAVPLVSNYGPAIDANAAAGNVRIIRPGDESALDSFLARHWLSSMILRANRLLGGVVDQGQPHQGTYAAVWEGSTIISVAAHYWNGLMAVQTLHSLAAVVRAAAAASRRPVNGFVGPWLQIDAAVNAIGRSQRRKLVGTAQTLLALDLGKLHVPEPLKKLGVNCRPVRADEIETFLPWRIACAIDTMGVKDSPELRASLRTETESLISANRLCVAETALPVGISVIDAAVPEAFQFGGIWTPVRLRNRGYEAAAAISLVQALRGPNIKHVVMLAPKTNLSLLRTYAAIGFTALGDYGTLQYVD